MVLGLRLYEAGACSCGISASGFRMARVACSFLLGQGLRDLWGMGKGTWGALPVRTDVSWNSLLSGAGK